MIIRQTREEEYFQTIELTRNAFWNVYKEGCDEHLVLNNFRKSSSFVKELDYVILEDERIVAHIMYTKAYIKTYNEEIEVLMFGPISVEPSFQNHGYGSLIITHTLEIAKKLKYKAVVITGNPDYYHRFGFVTCTLYNILLDEPASEEIIEEKPYFMIKELENGFLDSILSLRQRVKFITPAEYYVCDADLNEFEKQFSYKEKHAPKYKI